MLVGGYLGENGVSGMRVLRLWTFRVLPNGLRLGLWRAVMLLKRLFGRAPLLTVIVPVYNVEEYLEESFVSLRNQTVLDLQIIAVNDGSTDRSGELLERMASQDPRIEVVHQANAGLGAARNTGLTRSRGSFITFMDPDDLIPSTAYALMVDTLRRTGSRFVVGRIVRLKSGKYIMPGFSKQVHQFDRFGTSIEEFPDALMDIIACNRMFVRDFWMSEIGLFPEGVAYEDHVPVTAAYLRADRFDILHTTTYDWRIREDETSIGQQKHELQNLKDRLTAKYDAWEILRDYPSEQVRMAWVGRVLGMDLPAFVLPAVAADDAYRDELRKAIRFFTGLVTDDLAFDMGSTSNKVMLWLALNERWDDIGEAVDQVRKLGYLVPTTIEGGRVIANADQLGPLFADIPPEFLWPSKFELAPIATFENLQWGNAGNLVINGWANLTMVDMLEHPQDLEVSLVSEDGFTRIPAHVVREHNQRANYFTGHRFSDYVDAGFSATWDKEQLEPALQSRQRFAVQCVSSSAGVESATWIRRSAPDSSREARVWSSKSSRAHAWISNERGVIISGSSPTRDQYLTDEVHFGRLRRLLSARFVRVSDYSLNGEKLMLTVKSPLGHRALVGAKLGTRDKQTMLAPVSCTRGAAGWQLVFDLEHDPWGLGKVPLPNGRYVLHLANAMHARLERSFLQKFPISKRRGNLEVYPTSNKFLEFSLNLGDADLREVATVLTREQSLQAYREAPSSLEDAVLFECYLGAQISDSPLQIFRELQRRGSSLKMYWGVSNYSVQVPDGAIPVRVNSPEWFNVLSTAKYLCNNVDFPNWFIRRDGQEFIQTFHGQPFKQMGLQHWQQNGSTDARIAAETLRRQKAWTRMLLPHEEAVPWYERAYPGAGKVTVLGLPRNDELVVPDPEIESHVRIVLGIGMDQTLVMYAPTWRESNATSGWTATAVEFIDLEHLAAQLGPTFTVMYRGHNFNVRNGEKRREGASVVDASNYPDINHLILAADIAVLDYSSLRFDFAITGKPMVFFVPDEEEYFSLRPGLLPFRDTTPGPIVHEAEELATAIAQVSRVGAELEQSSAAIRSFNWRFNRLQDGNAAERVVDRIFPRE